MSSSFNRRGKDDKRKWSRETYESLVDSEEHTSSVIRLPQAIASSPSQTPLDGLPPPLPPKPDVTALSTAVGLPRAGNAPPPLPPKPAFARSQSIEHSAPPPLPPKPDDARGEKLKEGPKRTSSDQLSSPGVLVENGVPGSGLRSPHESHPPTRPVPPVPSSESKPSFGEDGSWIPSFHDEKSQGDAQFPPEPTIISDGDPKRSSLGKDWQDASTRTLSDPVASVALPLPLPPFAAHQHCIATLFSPFPISSSTENENARRSLALTLEGAEDSHIGAIVLSRKRQRIPQLATGFRPPPIEWRLYKKHEPGGEAWSVLQEFLTNVSLKSRGRNRALQLLTGYVIGACLESTDAGIYLLTEIVRRMRGAERSERDGSIFTLLINIGAHVSFVQRVCWSSVEEVILRVFSQVVEEMHGRQDDDVMWERALRCYLVLCKSSDQHPSDDISSKCLAALALHLGDMTHTDVDHVLIANGLCPRLQSNRDEKFNSACVDVKCLEDIGGIDTILTLYARTASPSSRHRLFAVIYDITVLQCLEELTHDEINGLKDHIATLRALLESHELADLFTHTFRVGPWPEFVMDTIRMLLFFPLSKNAQNLMEGRNLEDGDELRKQGFREKSENMSTSEVQMAGTRDQYINTAATRYIMSTRTLVKMLDKKFSLKVLRQMERMAAQHSGVLAQRESVHYAKEWKILSEIEGHVQRFLFYRGANTGESFVDVLTKLYVAVVDITSGRSSLKSILHMAEMVIELFTMRRSHSLEGGLRQDVIESLPQKFLRGRYSVSIDLLDQANPSIFTLLLLASQRKKSSRRLSECRQCLIEFLGSRRNRVDLLQTFVDDNDSTVAYRASEILSKFADPSLPRSTPGSANGDR